jgi:hypothetical protein
MAAVEGRIAAAMDAASEASGALARARELIRVNQERAQELETLSQRDSRETESAKTSLAGHRDELDALKKDLIAATDAHETARQELEQRSRAGRPRPGTRPAASGCRTATESLDLERAWPLAERMERNRGARAHATVAPRALRREKAEAEARWNPTPRVGLRGHNANQNRPAPRSPASGRGTCGSRRPRARAIGGLQKEFRSWRRGRRARSEVTCCPQPRRGARIPSR